MITKVHSRDMHVYDMAIIKDIQCILKKHQIDHNNSLSK